jgi:heterodisulfide reductase subunit A-like polyferredoxin
MRGTSGPKRSTTPPGVARQPAAGTVAVRTEDTLTQTRTTQRANVVIVVAGIEARWPAWSAA